MKKPAITTTTVRITSVATVSPTARPTLAPLPLRGPGVGDVEGWTGAPVDEGWTGAYEDEGGGTIVVVIATEVWLMEGVTSEGDMLIDSVILIEGDGVAVMLTDIEGLADMLTDILGLADITDETVVSSG